MPADSMFEVVCFIFAFLFFGMEAIAVQSRLNLLGAGLAAFSLPFLVHAMQGVR